MTSHSNAAYVNEDEFIYDDIACKRIGINDSTYGVEFINTRSPERIRSASRQRYVTVAILCFINLINYVDRFTIAGTLQEVQDFYSLGDTEAGLLQTAFIVSYMIMAPIFGYMGDRYSRKLIISVGVTFWSVTTLLGSFVPSHLFGIFIFLRSLVGTGEASYSTIAPTIIGDLFLQDQRSKMLAVFYFAIPVGSGLGYIVGNQSVAITGEWEWALRVTPILGFISVILTLLYVKDPPRGEAEGGSNIKPTTIKADLKDLCKTKSFLYSTFGFTCVSFASGALGWFGPKYMELAIARQAVGPAPPNAALIFGIITFIAGFVGVFIGSTLSQYLRKINGRADPLICAAGVLLSVPLIFSGVVASEYQTTTAWILIFLGCVCLSVNWTIVADMLLYVVIPTRRSMAEAVQILISHAFGDASSPYIIGLVSDAIGRSSIKNIDGYLSLQYALYIPTGILVIGALFFFMTAVHIERDKAKCSFATHASNSISQTRDSCYSLPVSNAPRIEVQHVKSNGELSPPIEMTSL